ncbi:hypothetical protein [Nannocystis pusilla]|uniref:hypothetical protein n=1 Tax=Nannocystis pusilla TaxID=889268 RepID=UPI003DA48F92
MTGSPVTLRLALLSFALTAACGPGTDGTSATIGTTTDAGTTAPGTTTGSSTSGTPTTSSTSGTTTTSAGTTEALTSTSEATTEDENPCGCANGDVCIQSFDGICTLLQWTCLPNPDGCVPGYPCSEACRAFCNGDSQDACNNSDCPDDIEGAVQCYGH